MRLVRRNRLKSMCGEDAMVKSMDREQSLAIVVCAELAMGCFLELLNEDPNGQRSPYELLLRRSETESDFLLSTLVRDKTEGHPVQVEELLGQDASEMVYHALRRWS